MTSSSIRSSWSQRQERFPSYYPCYCHLIVADNVEEMMLHKTDNLKSNLAKYRKRFSRLKLKYNQSVFPKNLKLSAFIEELKKYFPRSTHYFIIEQLNMSRKNSLQHRWSDETKCLELQLKNASPKCYKILRKLFKLPSLTTLKSILQKVEIKPGRIHKNDNPTTLKTD